MYFMLFNCICRLLLRFPSFLLLMY